MENSIVEYVVSTIFGGTIMGTTTGIVKSSKEITEDFIGILGKDRLAIKRQENIEKIKNKMSLKKDNLIESSKIDPFDFQEILEKASRISDEFLQEKWANLLTNYLHKEHHDKYRKQFLDILKNLTPGDAKFFNKIMLVVKKKGNLEIQHRNAEFLSDLTEYLIIAGLIKEVKVQGESEKTDIFKSYLKAKIIIINKEKREEFYIEVTNLGKKFYETISKKEED